MSAIPSSPNPNFSAFSQQTNAKPAKKKGESVLRVRGAGPFVDTSVLDNKKLKRIIKSDLKEIDKFNKELESAKVITNELRQRYQFEFKKLQNVLENVRIYVKSAELKGEEKEIQKIHHLFIQKPIPFVETALDQYEENAQYLAQRSFGFEGKTLQERKDNREKFYKDLIQTIQLTGKQVDNILTALYEVGSEKQRHRLTESHQNKSLTQKELDIKLGRGKNQELDRAYLKADFISQKIHQELKRRKSEFAADAIKRKKIEPNAKVMGEKQEIPLNDEGGKKIWPVETRYPGIRGTVSDFSHWIELNADRRVKDLQDQQLRLYPGAGLQLRHLFRDSLQNALLDLETKIKQKKEWEASLAADPNNKKFKEQIRALGDINLDQAIRNAKENFKKELEWVGDKTLKEEEDNPQTRAIVTEEQKKFILHDFDIFFFNAGADWLKGIFPDLEINTDLLSSPDESPMPTHISPITLEFGDTLKLENRVKNLKIPEERIVNFMHVCRGLVERTLNEVDLEIQNNNIKEKNLLLEEDLIQPIKNAFLVYLNWSGQRKGNEESELQLQTVYQTFNSVLASSGMDLFKRIYPKAQTLADLGTPQTSDSSGEDSLDEEPTIADRELLVFEKAADLAEMLATQKMDNEANIQLLFDKLHASLEEFKLFDMINRDKIHVNSTKEALTASLLPYLKKIVALLKTQGEANLSDVAKLALNFQRTNMLLNFTTHMIFKDMDRGHLKNLKGIYKSLSEMSEQYSKILHS